jgi:O-antigen ligase
LAFARSGQLSRPLWFLICGYIVAYMLRNSVDISALQQGYNLSPGFVIFSLLGFTFLGPRIQGTHRVALALAFVSMLWLALIGARSATGTIMIFLFVLAAWPLITRSKLMYALTLVGVVVAIVLFHVLYFAFATNSADPLVADASIGIFQKRLGTRIDIWVHLAYLIWESPWLGYGTDAATLDVAPLMMLEFSYNRSNLGSHSLYLELLYRLGVVGLAGFALLVVAIWRFYWIGRQEWATRVAAAFLASALVFGATSEYLVFGTMRLENGFAWALLGIGAGACLRHRRKAAVEARQRPS